MAGILFCHRRGLSLWDVGDTVIVTAPIGLGLGRLGNFINGELYGRPTDVPWAIIFPMGGDVPRHPCQLYEAAMEGILLFWVLWGLKDRGLRPGTLISVFLGGYGLLRFLVEFFRQPDPQVGLFWGVLSMGQLLCVGMMVAAVLLWLGLRQKGKNPQGNATQNPAA